MIREQVRSTLSGWLMVAVLLLGFAGALWGLISELLSGENSTVLVLAWAVAIILVGVLAASSTALAASYWEKGR